MSIGAKHDEDAVYVAATRRSFRMRLSLTAIALSILVAAIGCSNARSGIDTASRAAFDADDKSVCIPALSVETVAGDAPVQVPYRESVPQIIGAPVDKNRARVLIDAGFLKESDGVYDNGVRYHEYTLTDAGRALALMKSSGDTELCYGTKSYDSLIEFTTPAANADGQIVTQATYMYHVDVAPWAKQPAITAAFSDIASDLSNGGQHKVTVNLVQTSDGWRKQ